MIEMGFLVGTIIVGIITLALIIAIIFGAKHDWDNSYTFFDDVFSKKGFIITASVIGAIVLTIYAFATIPYNYAYHSYNQVSGTVSQVSNRLVSDGDSSVNQKFVVVFKGNPQEYGCEDTRCSLIKPGNQLTLSCIKVWVYGGTDGYDCQFVERKNE